MFSNNASHVESHVPLTSTYATSAWYIVEKSSTNWDRQYEVPLTLVLVQTSDAFPCLSRLKEVASGIEIQLLVPLMVIKAEALLTQVPLRVVDKREGTVAAQVVLKQTDSTIASMAAVVVFASLATERPQLS